MDKKIATTARAG